MVVEQKNRQVTGPETTKKEQRLEGQTWRTYHIRTKGEHDVESRYQTNSIDHFRCASEIVPDSAASHEDA